MASQSELQSNPEHNKNNKSSVSEVGHAKNVANFADLIFPIALLTDPPTIRLKQHCN